MLTWFVQQTNSETESLNTLRKFSMKTIATQSMLLNTFYSKYLNIIMKQMVYIVNWNPFQRWFSEVAPVSWHINFISRSYGWGVRARFVIFGCSLPHFTILIIVTIILISTIYLPWIMNQWLLRSNCYLSYPIKVKRKTIFWSRLTKESENFYPIM